MASQDETKKRISDDDAKEQVDHRKRRRNRTTLSCLNCHSSKRMCDRRRPACGRCTKLGLSGTCVYEVDDINRRDPAQDEVLLLKNRIAELEGFIREFKRKPHPRTITRRKRANSTSSSLPGSDNGGDSDSCQDSRHSVMTIVSRTSSPNESSSESDNDPRTPSALENEPVFLTSTGCPTSPLSSPSTSSNRFATLTTSSDPAKTGSDCIMDIDSTFDFRSTGLMCDDNDTLERVFARIIEQDVTSNHDCGCVKHHLAYSSIFELVPHLRRALSALRSAPEHHAQVSEFSSPCFYLSQLQSLTDAISSIIESPPGTTLASSSPPPCAPQSQRPLSNALLPSAACAEDSPLQRVIAARRAGLAGKPNPVRSASQTPITASAKDAWRGSNLRPAWGGGQSTSDRELPGSGKDSFMSWEPTQRGPWPRTISL
ncbi:hypothetical protein A7U60_g7802 [Sanghuangporus baumii]|uniref:Zn(2)-C6 fungal-type domain-containing protein n=1 Tax=Sanghuangporus baumii TaxID=108892 RepID=A0A9Q5HSL7_SANBA|nr:hypothetical protein A7U60_g7802 [Sanghuangporus baumii]